MHCGFSRVLWSCSLILGSYISCLILICIHIHISPQPSIHSHASTTTPHISPLSQPNLKMSFTKAEASSETHSFSAPPTSEHPAMRQPSPSSFKSKSQLITSVHLGLTVLSLLSALTIVGTSASTLEVYNTTRLGKGQFLSIWPNEFDIRPTVALVTCGTIILVSSVLGLIVAKIPAVRLSPSLLPSSSLSHPSKKKTYSNNTFLNRLKTTHSSAHPSPSSSPPPPSSQP